MFNIIYSQQLKNRVMARIYAIYVWRQTTSPICLKTFAIGSLLGSGMLWFSWEQIFLNMFPMVDGVLPFFRFSWSAFLNTDLRIQSIVVISSGMILWLVWDILPAAKTVVYKPLRLFRPSAV